MRVLAIAASFTTNISKKVPSRYIHEDGVWCASAHLRPGVRVGGPTAEAVVADLRDVLEVLPGVNSAYPALRICGDFYPDEPIAPRSAAVLHELFG